MLGASGSSLRSCHVDKVPRPTFDLEEQLTPSVHPAATSYPHTHRIFLDTILLSPFLHLSSGRWVRSVGIAEWLRFDGLPPPRSGHSCQSAHFSEDCGGGRERRNKEDLYMDKNEYRGNGSSDGGNLAEAGCEDSRPIRGLHYTVCRYKPNLAFDICSSEEVQSQFQEGCVQRIHKRRIMAILPLQLPHRSGCWSHSGIQPVCGQSRWSMRAWRGVGDGFRTECSRP